MNAAKTNVSVKPCKADEVIGGQAVRNAACEVSKISIAGSIQAESEKFEWVP